jgi:hypothetical protein
LTPVIYDRYVSGYKIQIILYLLVILAFYDFNPRDKQALNCSFRMITWDGDQ